MECVCLLRLPRYAISGDFVSRCFVCCSLSGHGDMDAREMSQTHARAREEERNQTTGPGMLCCGVVFGLLANSILAANLCADIFFFFGFFFSSLQFFLIWLPDFRVLWRTQTKMNMHVSVLSDTVFTQKYGYLLRIEGLCRSRYIINQIIVVYFFLFGFYRDWIWNGIYGVGSAARASSN